MAKTRTKNLKKYQRYTFKQKSKLLRKNLGKDKRRNRTLKVKQIQRTRPFHAMMRGGVRSTVRRTVSFDDEGAAAADARRAAARGEDAKKMKMRVAAAEKNWVEADEEMRAVRDRYLWWEQAVSEAKKKYNKRLETQLHVENFEDMKSQILPILSEAEAAAEEALKYIKTMNEYMKKLFNMYNMYFKLEEARLMISSPTGDTIPSTIQWSKKFLRIYSERSVKIIKLMNDTDINKVYLLKFKRLLERILNEEKKDSDSDDDDDDDSDDRHDSDDDDSDDSDDSDDEEQQSEEAEAENAKIREKMDKLMEKMTKIIKNTDDAQKEAYELEKELRQGVRDITGRDYEKPSFAMLSSVFGDEERTARAKAEKAAAEAAAAAEERRGYRRWVEAVEEAGTAKVELQRYAEEGGEEEEAKEEEIGVGGSTKTQGGRKSRKSRKPRKMRKSRKNRY